MQHSLHERPAQICPARFVHDTQGKTGLAGRKVRALNRQMP
jgi:hypothetical protein